VLLGHLEALATIEGRHVSEVLTSIATRRV